MIFNKFYHLNPFYNYLQKFIRENTKFQKIPLLLKITKHPMDLQSSENDLVRQFKIPNSPVFFFFASSSGTWW